MKRVAIVLVLIVVSSSAWAEYGKFGVGIVGAINNARTVDTAGIVTDDTSFWLYPTFSMMLSEKLELSPYLYFGLDTTTVDGNLTQQVNRIGAGSGLYWHFVRAPHLHLGTGATAELRYKYTVKDPTYLTDTDFRIVAVMPLLADVVLNDHIAFRATLDVVNFQLRFTKTNNGSGDISAIYFDVTTYNLVPGIKVGLIVRFG